MSYPQSERLAEASDERSAIADFLEWMGQQGVNRMVYRTDLTDTRECYGPTSAHSLERCDKAPRPTCEKCGGTGFREVTGLESWVHDGRSDDQLIYDFLDIDGVALERERRAMLDALRTPA